MRGKEYETNERRRRKEEGSCSINREEPVMFSFKLNEMKLLLLHKINKYNDPKSRPNKIKYMCSSNLSKSKKIKTKRVIMLELRKNINLKKKK